jgi:hypothetical protein
MLGRRGRKLVKHFLRQLGQLLILPLEFGWIVLRNGEEGLLCGGFSGHVFSEPE